MPAPRFTIRSLFVLITICAVASLILASARDSMVWEAVAVVCVGTIIALGLILLVHVVVYLGISAVMRPPKPTNHEPRNP
jgi:hypothetical protein